MSCCVVGCRNRHIKNGGIRFFRIPIPTTPSEAERSHLWLRAIRRADWIHEISRNPRVCSAHFISGKASKDPESPDYVPSLFPYSRQSQLKAASKKMDRFNRRRRRAEGIPRSSLTDTSSSLTAASTVEPTAEFQQPLDCEEDLCPPTHPVSAELCPSLQQCDIKVEETTVQEHPQVKEEQVDQCISPHMNADTWNDTEVRLPKTEPDVKSEPSSTALTEGVNEKVPVYLYVRKGFPCPPSGFLPVIMFTPTVSQK